jgi:hypothetical protein
MQTAKDVYLKKPEGRLKSTLRGALYGAVEGLRSGQGLGAGLGGAVAGGTVGAVSPRTIRRAQFETEVAPQILQRHQLEDAEAQRLRQMATDEQNAMMSRARLEDLEAGIELKRSQAEENRLPRPTPGPAPSWQRGRNRRTGQFAVFNAADPAQNAEHEPYIEERQPQTRWVVNDQGVYEDVIKATREGRKVRALQRPKAAPKPKEEPKVASISQVRKAAEEHFGGDVSEAEAAFVRKGYRIVGK